MNYVRLLVYLSVLGAGILGLAVCIWPAHPVIGALWVIVYWHLSELFYVFVHLLLYEPFTPCTLQLRTLVASALIVRGCLCYAGICSTVVNFCGASYLLFCLVCLCLFACQPAVLRQSGSLHYDLRHTIRARFASYKRNRLRPPNQADTHAVAAAERRFMERFVLYHVLPAWEFIRQPGANLLRWWTSRDADLARRMHVCKICISAKDDQRRDQGAVDGQRQTTYHDCGRPGEDCPYRVAIPWLLLVNVADHVNSEQLAAMVTGPSFIVRHNPYQTPNVGIQPRAAGVPPESFIQRFGNQLKMRILGGLSYQHSFHEFGGPELNDEGVTVTQRGAFYWCRVGFLGTTELIYAYPTVGERSLYERGTGNTKSTWKLNDREYVGLNKDENPADWSYSFWRYTDHQDDLPRRERLPYQLVESLAFQCEGITWSSRDPINVNNLVRRQIAASDCPEFALCSTLAQYLRLRAQEDMQRFETAFLLVGTPWERNWLTSNWHCVLVYIESLLLLVDPNDGFATMYLRATPEDRAWYRKWFWFKFVDRDLSGPEVNLYLDLRTLHDGPIPPYHVARPKMPPTVKSQKKILVNGVITAVEAPESDCDDPMLYDNANVLKLGPFIGPGQPETADYHRTHRENHRQDETTEDEYYTSHFPRQKKYRKKRPRDNLRKRNPDGSVVVSTLLRNIQYHEQAPEEDDDDAAHTGAPHPDPGVERVLETKTLRDSGGNTLVVMLYESARIGYYFSRSEVVWSHFEGRFSVVPILNEESFSNAFNVLASTRNLTLAIIKREMLGAILALAPE